MRYIDTVDTAMSNMNNTNSCRRRGVADTQAKSVSMAGIASVSCHGGLESSSNSFPSGGGAVPCRHRRHAAVMLLLLITRCALALTPCFSLHLVFATLMLGGTKREEENSSWAVVPKQNPDDPLTFSHRPAANRTARCHIQPKGDTWTSPRRTSRSWLVRVAGGDWVFC